MAPRHSQRQLGRPLSHPSALLATWFGVGLLPRAPGTWGSLAALPLAWLVHQYTGIGGMLAATIILFLVGWWASTDLLRAGGAQDPGHIVIDEVAGQFLTIAAVASDPVKLAVGFVLFRLFDIVKPWPVSWADRRIKGGLGVMLDDVLAGGYALGILSVVGIWWK